MKRWCSKSCSCVAASARLARRPSSSRARIVFQSIGNVSLSLRETLFEYNRLEQISIVYESGIFLETHKAVSHDSFTPKEVIRVFVVVVLFRRCCCCCCCCRGKVFSSLFHVRCGDHLWGKLSRANFPQKRKKSSLCALSRVVSVVVSQKTVAAFDTKNNKEEREREQSGFYRARAYYISASLVFLQKRVFLLPRGVEYSGAFDSSREADARRECWNAEKRIRFLCTTDDDDEDAIFGRMHPRSSSNFDDDDFDDEWCFLFGRYRPERGQRWR